MTIQVVIKFQISNFQFLAVPQEESLRRPQIKNPKNIILKAIELSAEPKQIVGISSMIALWRLFRPTVILLCRKDPFVLLHPV